MEARLKIWGLNREFVLLVAAVVVFLAAMAAGYGVRAITGGTDAHTVYISSGGTAPAAQGDTPCVRVAAGKGC